jgi:hypothetical protein
LFSSFRYGVDAELGYDGLQFEISGEVKLPLVSNTGMEKRAGKHTLKERERERERERENSFLSCDLLMSNKVVN